MIEDLPVFGYPIKPTEICFLSLCNSENCRNNVMRLPFPNEFVIEA